MGRVLGSGSDCTSYAGPHLPFVRPNKWWPSRQTCVRTPALPGSSAVRQSSH